MPEPKLKVFWTPFKITAVYLIFGVLWILLSDSFLNWVITDKEKVAEIQIYKGWLFVSLTTLFLYYFIKIGFQKTLQIERTRLKIKSFRESLIESENRYQNLIETANEGVWTINSEGILTFANTKIAEMLGYDTDEMLGRYYFDFVHEDKKEEAIQRFQKCRDGEKGQIDFHLKDSKEKSCWVLASCNPIYKNEEFSGVLMMMTDITERRKDQEALQRNEAQLRLITHNIPALIARIDKNLTYRFANNAYNDWLGIDPQSLIGKSVGELITKENFEGILPSIERVLAGETVTFDYKLIFKAIGERYVKVNYIPDFDAKGNVDGYFALIVDLTERREAEELIKQSEAFSRAVINSFNSNICVIDQKGWITAINDSWNAFGKELKTNQSPTFLMTNIGANYIEVLENSRTDEEKEEIDLVLKGLRDILSGEKETFIHEYLCRNKENVKWFLMIVTPLKTDRRGAVIVHMDITERKEAEETLRKGQEQLAQSQKLESVGRLAGGVAHDFNNMLTAINGYSDLILMKMEQHNPFRSSIKEIKKAGERSAYLTQQLLAFSRAQVLKPENLNINHEIKDILSILKRVIGEDISLITVLSNDIKNVKVDPGQLTQVILNLAVNARDAMPHGGKLTIETSNVFLDENYISEHVDVKSGEYVMIAITDTGIGMDLDSQQRIFEPFFTTKETGKGTGLGLATVYGIIKQSNGYILVYSEPQMGTTFKVYFPVVEGQKQITEKRSVVELMTSGTETILLVEDEPMVRNLNREILETYGYKIIEAANGIEALEVCEKTAEKIDLLMTDIVMPKMGGRELAEKINVLYPQIKVLFTSGYTNDTIVRQGVIEDASHFLQKPFSVDLLIKTVREILKNS